MKEILISEIENIKIGQVENVEAATGCTVFISEKGMYAGMDVRGGGPASRESQLLNPLTVEHDIHGVVLSGGSAFGLGVANGVMECLEKRGIGYDVGPTKVPLVVQSDIFDLKIGDTFTRPGPEMGFEAATIALDVPNYRDGCFGAGCGATVGKFKGMDRCTKSGIGSYAVQIGELKIGAVVVVNAYGDVFDWKTGEQIAGLLSEDKKGFSNTSEGMRSIVGDYDNKFLDEPTNEEDIKEDMGGLDGNDKFVGNTTLGVIITNAKFGKTKLCKIAGMAHDGLARSIRPVHTSADGDITYALSVGDVDADQDLVGILAAEVVSEAIIRAVYSAESSHGIPAPKDIVR